MKVQVIFSILLACVVMRQTPASILPPTDGDISRTRKTVEVVVVVDQPAYRQWREFQRADSEEDRDEQTVAAIEQFVRTTFVSANLIWKGMEEHGVYLDLRIDSIRVETDDAILTPGSDGRTVMNEAAYWGFFHWLIRNGFEFDHALLLTGLNLGSNTTHSHEGYAYMDTMCTPQSVSLVENIINGIPSVVTAHEIAHSLGARHDGDYNSCNRTSGHIMNDNNIGTSPQHWQFSNCSARAVKGTLDRLARTFDCLSEGSTRSPPVDSPYLGQVYTGDELCQMSQGSHSYVCRHLYNRPDSRGICEVLWCLVNSTYCTGVAPVDGLPCGAGKRCEAGECLPFDDVGDDVTDTCYTGDKPGKAWREQSCGQVVASFTHLCQDQWYQDFCCSSCHSVSTGDERCPYGDAHDRCAPYYCGTQWEEECCQTCRP